MSEITTSIASKQFNDPNPPDSDKPANVEELSAVTKEKSRFYTAVVVTDKTGGKSVFQLMQVSLEVCLDTLTSIY